MPNPTTIHPNGPPHCCLSSTITIIIDPTSASTDAPHLKDPKKQPIETRQLEHVPKKLLAFFDKDMLQLFEFERFLFDHLIPGDRESLQAIKTLPRLGRLILLIP
jgi:hypothetical protein